ncbi:MAG: Glutamate/gamma-aminobutyrate antiporter [Chlamydiia bacterium]|nr:Glutamate/gamma-aminobutyrate antiporter [Chlamydiia bacterium]
MTQNKKTLTVFLLLMINLATVLSIRNWPITAMYGYTSIFYLLLSAIFFFIPCALVSAELATLYPKKGGVFVWVKEALGHRMGFLAVWLLWAENIVFYPALLSFISAAVAYTFFPGLANDPIYTCLMVIGVFWLVTFVNLRGIHFTGAFSTFCVIAGTFIPTALILTLGTIWIFSGNPMMVTLESTPLLPDFSMISTFAVLTGILLSFGGLEMPAVHANDVKNPKKSFPTAILLSAGIIVTLTILGTLCIAIVIPREDISLVSGTIEAMSAFLTQYNMSFLMPFMAILIAIGALGGLSSWVVGPCKGLLASAESGDFPPFMQKTNKNGMPHVLMFIQGGIVTCLSLLFVLMPNVSSSFWILTVLSAQLYIVMYILLFISGIVLKYKKPNMPRAYSVPGGTIGMWIVAGLGLLGVTFSLVIGFFPPPDVVVDNIIFFESFLLIGIISMILLPIWIHTMRRPSWKRVLKQQPKG